MIRVFFEMGVGKGKKMGARLTAQGSRPGRKGGRKVLRTRLRPLDYAAASLRDEEIGLIDLAVRRVL